MWDELLRTFRVDGPITYPAIAASELERYERENGLTLPRSYKEFCSVFGPGELVYPSSFRIAAPGPKTCDDLFELRLFNQWAEEAHCESSYDVEAPQEVEALSAALYFCSDIGNWFYFWHRREVTSAADSEYAVYLVDRSYDIHRLSDTFADFVQRICLVEGVPGEAPDIERERVFRPDRR